MPAEAWADGVHVVRLWLSSARDVPHTVQYGKAGAPEFSDTFRNEGDARRRYEDLVARYKEAQSR